MNKPLLSRDPETAFGPYHFHDIPWRARWISDPAWDHASPVVSAFRCVFDVAESSVVPIHVTADQRYDLYLDGERVAWGSERGMPTHWYYESYDLKLAPGPHTLVARVWWVGTGDIAHLGHSTLSPAFLLHAEGEWAERLDTTSAAWTVRTLPGYSFCLPQLSHAFHAVGARTLLRYSPDVVEALSGAGEGWLPAVEVSENAFRAAGDECHTFNRLLAPAVLPRMYEAPRSVGTVRYAKSTPLSAGGPSLETSRALPFSAAESDPALAASFSALAAGTAPAVVPARSFCRVLLRPDDYLCAWPQLRFSGGAGARIRVGWAESLFESADPAVHAKGDRDACEGKFFRGMYDEVVADGSSGAFFESLWWEAGAWILLAVETADEPLALESFSLRETHYPVAYDFAFRCSDARWDAVQPLLRRALEMCSHESYMDCPYYEQLMYGGDTRLELLTTLATTRDDRLPRKAMTLFDQSRSDAGLTTARVPTRRKQVIPPFSLWWIHMVSDYALWRGDKAFVRDRLQGVRDVLLAYFRHVGDDGLLRAPLGWNFVDWTGWKAGIPPAGDTGGACSIHNLHYAWTLRLAATLEDFAGDAGLAAWDRALADRVGSAAVRVFWDDARCLFADDPAHSFWSQHAQALALLGGFVPAGREDAVARNLASDTSLVQATVYFSYYVFEALYKARLPGPFYDRFALWFSLPGLGLRTTVEQPEPSRSDCHAWGAHPLFSALCSLAGVRPAAPGFQAVAIEPMPCGLTEIDATVPHPRGAVSVRIRLGADSLWHGTLSTPAGHPSSFRLGSQSLVWAGGSVEL